MFGCIAVTAVVDGLHARNQQHASTRGWTYVGIGSAMILAAVGIFAWNAASPFDHWVLAIEATLIGLFALFWAMQTVDLWNHTSRREAIAAATTDPHPAPYQEAGRARSAGGVEAPQDR